MAARRASIPTAGVGELTATAAVGELTRLVWGGLLLAAPGRVLRAMGGHPGSTPSAILRVLGVRHLVQAAVLLRWPTPEAFRLGAVADGLHALTAVALIADRRRRRLAVTDAAIATGWTVHDGVAASRAGARGRR
ncbi:hypothetical protein [Salinispora mooreana]|uniref:hypothetical protein n=1 Tax=Salinispora mooreana TaxID=999545 RepID=UPI00036CB490|nr:hypothetical protein [Salinispora mooreana]